MFGNLILVVTAFMSLYLAIKFFGLKSFLVLGVVGSIIYAMPAFLNMTPPQQFIPTGQGRYFIAPSNHTIYAYIAYFVFIIINIFIFKGQKKIYTESYISKQHITLAIYMCLLGWYLISVFNDGFFFFLKDRFDINQSVLELVFKWSIPISIYYGMMTKNPIRFIGYLFLFIQFLTGDRTMLAITLAGIIFIFIKGHKSIRYYLNFRYIFAASLVFSVVMFGKPIYLIIKTGTLEYALEFLNPDTLMFFIVGFEPFSIFNHFDFVVREGLIMSPIDFIKATAGNLFINPSSVDITVNQTNLYLMNAYPNFITNGIGGSYLANAWMFLRVPGLYLFSLIFVLSLIFCDVFSKKRNAFVASIIILLGALISVYSHRNGLGNILAFIRQIFICGGIIFLFSLVLQLLYIKKR